MAGLVERHRKHRAFAVRDPKKKGRIRRYLHIDADVKTQQARANGRVVAMAKTFATARRGSGALNFPTFSHFSPDVAGVPRRNTRRLPRSPRFLSTDEQTRKGNKPHDDHPTREPLRRFHAGKRSYCRQSS